MLVAEDMSCLAYAMFSLNYRRKVVLDHESVNLLGA